MKKTTDAELKRMIKEIDIYKIEEMYFMGRIKLTSSQVDFLIEQKHKKESRRITKWKNLYQYLKKTMY